MTTSSQTAVSSDSTTVGCTTSLWLFYRMPRSTGQIVRALDRQYLLTKKSLILTCHCATRRRHHCHQWWLSPFHLPYATTVSALTPSGPSAITFLSREVLQCSCLMSDQAKPQEPKTRYSKAKDFVYEPFMSPGNLTALLPRFGIYFRKEFLKFLFISHKAASQKGSTGIWAPKSEALSNREYLSSRKKKANSSRFHMKCSLYHTPSLLLEISSAWKPSDSFHCCSNR